MYLWLIADAPGHRPDRLIVTGAVCLGCCIVTGFGAGAGLRWVTGARRITGAGGFVVVAIVGIGARRWVRTTRCVG